ncbi:MAG: helix-turn-helix transcriptional regulator [Candidatus Tectomicrobia bacterium]|nr:helix-turn-helix transcriptional regulator [Candidatus Tectomicrobia bacterium]
MLADAEVRHAYDALAAEFDLARELIAARARAGLTQAQVAERMGTSQSAVARLEGGRRLPSMTTLLRYAEATGSRPVVKLVGDETTRRRKRAMRAGGGQHVEQR